jgi:hypothetical protein
MTMRMTMAKLPKPPKPQKPPKPTIEDAYELLGVLYDLVLVVDNNLNELLEAQGIKLQETLQLAKEASTREPKVSITFEDSPGSVSLPNKTKRAS